MSLRIRWATRKGRKPESPREKASGATKTAPPAARSAGQTREGDALLLLWVNPLAVR